MKASVLAFKSLRAQIIICVALPVVATLGLILFFLLSEFYEQLKAGALANIQLTTAKAAEEIDKANLESITIPKTMAIAQQNGLFGNRVESIRFAEEVLALHPQLTGAYFGYEPNADGQDGVFLESASEEDRRAVDESGRFLPYWYRDHDDDSVIQLEPLVDMETSFYYQGAKNRATGEIETRNISFADELSKLYETPPPDREMSVDDFAMITEPYVYEGKLIVEQTYPIIIDGEFKGIAGVDRALAFLQRYLENLKDYQTAEFMLVSRRGRVIASTMPGDFKGVRVEDMPNRGILSEFYQGGMDAEIRLVKTASGQRRFYDSVKVPTGHWTLVMSVATQEIYAPLNRHVAYLATISVLGLSITLLLMIWLANSICRRLTHAANLAGRVADGDLTADVEVATQDEAGVVLRSLQAMIGNLNALIGKVKSSSIQLTSTATTISSNAKSQEEAVGNFESSTNSIAAAIKEISTTSQELSSTMNKVTDNANNTANLADSGRTSLDSLETEMGKLATVNDAISERLNVIRERAQNVNQVITTITTVADRANLLSLNASIEAAKAGKFGRGFSVVASEIRLLADRTAEATLEIEKMVKEMQDAVASGVDEMTNLNRQMGESASEVNAVSNQLTAIIQQVQELTEQFENVRQGMDTQSIGAKHIDEAMLQLKEAARSTSSSITGFKRATEELQSLVSILRTEVNRFQMKGGEG